MQTNATDIDWAILGCPDPSPNVKGPSKTAILKNFINCRREKICPVYGSVSHLTENDNPNDGCRENAEFWTQAIRRNFVLFSSNFVIRKGLIIMTHYGCRGSLPYLSQRRDADPDLTDFQYQTQKTVGAALWFRQTFPEHFRHWEIKGIFVDQDGQDQMINIPSEPKIAANITPISDGLAAQMIG